MMFNLDVSGSSIFLVPLCKHGEQKTKRKPLVLEQITCIGKIVQYHVVVGI